MMKLLVFMMCLLVTTFAAPAPQSENTEEKQIAAHANEALRWMEIYRLYQQQGIVRNPFLPAADVPVDAAPAQPADAPLLAPIAVGDASEEETENDNPAPKAGAPAPPAAPLNSDEAEEAEEVEAAEAEPAVVEAAPADPAVAVELAVVDVPVDAAPVDAAAVDAGAADAGAAPLAAFN
ncbi:enamelin [Chaetodon auriga]|uniref:enamelin n=1 Tax=Chaetodon auriga TaxID=39042 RepID=UPI004032CC07